MNYLEFAQPQALFLLLLLPVLWHWLCQRAWNVSSILKLAIVACAILALAQPIIRFPDPGIDIIVVSDQSASCQQNSQIITENILSLIDKNRQPADRTAIIDFAADTVIRRQFKNIPDFYPETVNNHHASNISRALTLAATIRIPQRRTAIICVSDGLYTDVNPTDSETMQKLANTPVWTRTITTLQTTEFAALPFTLPATVEPNTAWIVGYNIYASTDSVIKYQLQRGNFLLEQGELTVKKGDNAFFARDTTDKAGLLEYKLTIEAANDNNLHNNQSSALLIVTGAARLLHVSSNLESNLIAQTLQASAIPFDSILPGSLPQMPAELVSYKVVWLENCRLTDMPEIAVQSLAEAVERGLVSLIVSGGANSFGNGGYHRSRLDPLLPVDNELRQDIQRDAVAIAFALDRSGSMLASVGGGKNKMDLANLATAESLRLLSSQDQVAVFAIDSSAHTIVPLSNADKIDPLVNAILRIRSMGGGIFCHTALKSMYDELQKSNLHNRHMVLFADAADAEEQEGCLDLVTTALKEGIGTSVVALGSHRDSDADFLINLAYAGGSEALFCEDSFNLPALFSQEVIRVSKRGFITGTTAIDATPSYYALRLPDQQLPTIEGYNFTSLRPEAEAMWLINDEFASPLIALYNRGMCHSAALTFEIDGEFSGQFAAWQNSPGLLALIVRQLAGLVQSSLVAGYSQLSQSRAVVELEFSTSGARKFRGSDIKTELLGPGGQVIPAALNWKSADVAEIVTELMTPGHYLPIITMPDNKVLKIPSVTLPYSAEFMPRSQFEGEKVMSTLGRITGGGEFVNISDVVKSATRLYLPGLDCTWYLLLLCLILFLVELANRRLLLFRS